jgi:hypothetical protein
MVKTSFFVRGRLPAIANGKDNVTPVRDEYNCSIQRKGGLEKRI